MSEFAVLISSCDKYADLWEPFFNLFWRYWSDCPYPVYLGSNEQAFEHPKVESILVGKDRDWTFGARKMVEHVNAEYVLIMLEDFFIREPVDTERVCHYIKLLKELKGNLLRLRPPIYRPFERMKDHPELARFIKDSPYIVSLQPTIWRTQWLVSLMRDGESAWDFEIEGTRRANEDFGNYFMLLKDRPIEWKNHVVEKGKWFLTEARRYKDAGIGCDFSRREIMTLSEQILWTIRKKKEVLRNRFIPWTLRKRVRDIGRRIIKGR